MIGYDGSEYEDIMFGHGGDDFMQAGGGLNYLIGGSGADRFGLRQWLRILFW